MSFLQRSAAGLCLVLILSGCGGDTVEETGDGCLVFVKTERCRQIGKTAICKRLAELLRRQTPECRRADP